MKLQDIRKEREISKGNSKESWSYVKAYHAIIYKIYNYLMPFKLHDF